MQAESFTHDESASVCARINEYNGLFSIALGMFKVPKQVYTTEFKLAAVQRVKVAR